MNLIRQLFSRRKLARELSEEVQAHLDEKIEELMESGMSLKDARAAARREFGNVKLLEERAREVWRWNVLEDVAADMRYAFRQLRRAPVFALAAVSTLAFGIGANTAVFSVVNAVMLRPLPYAEPDRLVAVRSLSIRGTPHPEDLSYPTFFDFRALNQVFDHLVCYRDGQFTIGTAERPVHVDGEIVSWDLFPMLGIKPELGRGFLPDEERPGSNVVVVSREFWQTRFGGDPSLVGRAIMLDGSQHTVVGIAPRGFRFPAENKSAQIWTTIAKDARFETGQPITEQRGARLINAMARLRPGTGLEEARAQMDVVASSLARQYPDSNKNLPATIIQPALAMVVGQNRGPLLILLGAVGLVLLIACANIANLLLARTAERQREFSVRAAIGASRQRVARQLLTESAVLALLGCIGGLILALALGRVLLPLAGDKIPRIDQSSVDGRVLAFSLAVAALTSILFSLAPLLHVARHNLASSLQEGGRAGTHGHDRLRRILVVGQIALGLMLMSGASLLIASFVNLARQDPGVKTDHVLTFTVNLPSARYNTARSISFYDQLLERLNGLPGVWAAAAGGPLPFIGDQINISFDIEERPMPPGSRPHADMAIVTPAYFETMGMPLFEGRDFSQRDDASTLPVLVVNRAFADKFFPGEAVIGKRIRPGATGPSGQTTNEIVGVVGNARQSPLASEPEPIYYFAYKQLSWSVLSVAVRTAAPPTSAEAPVREVVASLDAEEPIFDVKTLEDLQSSAIAQPRFQMLLISTFAGVALLLILVGLYGLMAYTVMKRTREIGVRIAMGASSSAVLKMVLASTMAMVAVGLIVGLAGSIAGASLLQGMLYGVAPRDPALMIIACAAVTITGLVAAYLPAHRAATIDPMQALRTE